MWVRSLGQEDPWRRTCQPTPVFLPGKFPTQRSLAAYNPWGHKESDMTERLTLQNNPQLSSTPATYKLDSGLLPKPLWVLVCAPVTSMTHIMHPSWYAPLKEQIRMKRAGSRLLLHSWETPILEQDWFPDHRGKVDITVTLSQCANTQIWRLQGGWVWGGRNQCLGRGGWSVL